MVTVQVIPNTNAKYLATNDGRILSRKVNRFLKPFEKMGYLHVDIMGRHQKIHSLVLFAFKGPRPEGLVINHIDGNKHNNKLSNLEYCTQSHNRKEDFRTGRQSFLGERNNISKLTEYDVMTIIEMYKSGEYSYGDLAKSFKVSRSGISNIFLGHTWSYLTGIKTKNLMVCPIHKI